MTLRADGDIDVELVMPCECVEVALPVRDQPDPEPVGSERIEHGDGVVVEVEVGVDLPATDDLDGAGARAVGSAAHATNDVLGERDPDLLVVLELGVHPQVGEGRDPRLLVPLRVEARARVSPPPAGRQRARAPARAARG